MLNFVCAAGVNYKKKLIYYQNHIFEIYSQKKLSLSAKKNDMIQDLNLMNFDDKISKGIALVDFWAPWCQPCLDQNPVLDEIASEIELYASVFKVDVNDNRVISNKEGVQNIPLLILYQDGKQISRFQGIQSKEIIISSVFKLMEKQ